MQSCVARLLAKDPARRFSSAAAAREALARSVADPTANWDPPAVAASPRAEAPPPVLPVWEGDGDDTLVR